MCMDMDFSCFGLTMILMDIHCETDFDELDVVVEEDFEDFTKLICI